jgi:hypothetical protein
MLALLTAVLLAACAPPADQGGVRGTDRKATIVMYYNSAGRCATTTTRYVKVPPNGKIRWKIDDTDTDPRCITGSYKVFLRFPSGTLDRCNGANGTNNIECDAPADTTGVIKYEVLYGEVFNSPITTEDPEIQIAM